MYAEADLRLGRGVARLDYFVKELLSTLVSVRLEVIDHMSWLGRKMSMGMEVNNKLVSSL
jgi:hypothetical protein